MSTVAFTGSRSFGFKIPKIHKDYLYEQIRGKLIEIQPIKIITGMALGIDTFAAEIAIDLQIPFIAAVPFVGQEFAWPLKQADHYRALLKKAQEVKIVTEGRYSGWKMQKRNEWMVDNSDKLIVVWDGKSVGTRNCVNYADGKIDIIYIDPKYSVHVDPVPGLSKFKG